MKNKTIYGTKKTVFVVTRRTEYQGDTLVKIFGKEQDAKEYIDSLNSYDKCRTDYEEEDVE